MNIHTANNMERWAAIDGAGNAVSGAGAAGPFQAALLAIDAGARMMPEGGGVIFCAGIHAVDAVNGLTDGAAQTPLIASIQSLLARRGGACVRWASAFNDVHNPQARGMARAKAALDAAGAAHPASVNTAAAPGQKHQCYVCGAVGDTWGKGQGPNHVVSVCVDAFNCYKRLREQMERRE